MANETLDTLIQNREKTQARMRDLGIPMWITWVEDNGAENETLSLIGAPHGAANRAYVLTPDNAVSFCFHTEAGKQQEYGFELVRTDRDVLTPLVEGLEQHFEMSQIDRIALNFSDDLSLDTLGHGNYEKITAALTRRYEGLEFMSADQLTTATQTPTAKTSQPIEVNDKILKNSAEKRKQTQSLMRDLGHDLWVIIAANNDAEKAHLPLIGAPEGEGIRAYVLTADQAISFCPSENAELQRRHGFESIMIEGDSLSNNDFPAALAEILNTQITLNPGMQIALNISSEFGTMDTLGQCTYEKLTAALEEKCQGLKFSSSDQLIIAAASAKLPYEINLLTEAASLTDRVLRETFAQIKAGMTEKDVAAITKGLIAELMEKDSRINYGWKAELNPIVLAGEGIGGSPHAPPTNRIIQPGDNVYIDLGISVEGYGGDLQHFGYVLREGETEAPAEVQAQYNLVIRSIEAGMAAAVPGALGWEVDKAARDVIVEAGYPSYDHGTGHQLGCGNDHAPGMLFERRFPNGEGTAEFRLSTLALQEGYTMTIEPRIQVPNGASIEVDGMITKDGFKPLVPMQDRIHLIR